MNRKERRKALFEWKEKKRQKTSHRKDSGQKRTKRQKVFSSEESEWDSELERIIHRTETRHKTKSSRSYRENHRKGKEKDNSSDRSRHRDRNCRDEKTNRHRKDSSRNYKDERTHRHGKNSSSDHSPHKEKQDMPVKSDRKLVKEVETQGNVSDSITEVSGNKHDGNLADNADETVSKLKEDTNIKDEKVKEECMKREVDWDNGCQEDMEGVTDVVDISSDSLSEDDCVVVSSDTDMESGELSNSTSSDSSSESSDSYSDVDSSEEDMEEETGKGGKTNRN